MRTQSPRKGAGMTGIRNAPPAVMSGCQSRDGSPVMTSIYGSTRDPCNKPFYLLIRFDAVSYVR
jgi:hypothetical protein